MTNVHKAAQVIAAAELPGRVLHESQALALANTLAEAGLLKTEFEESELSRLYGMETVVERGIRKGWLNECEFEDFL